jgi:hypothetical protein
MKHVFYVQYFFPEVFVASVMIKQIVLYMYVSRFLY